MNKNSDNKIKLTFHPAEFGAKMPIPLAEQSVKQASLRRHKTIWRER